MLKIIAQPSYEEYFYNRVEAELNQVPTNEPVISIFGSARTGPETHKYQQALKIGRTIGERLGISIITGGGPGIMAAANEGAHLAKVNSYGCTVTFNKYEPPNLFVNRSRNFEFFFTRKLALTLNSVAIVNMPGGFGTQDEAFEVLALKDRNPNINVPVLFVRKSFYKPWAELMQRDYDLGYLRRQPHELFTVLDKTYEVVDHLEQNINKNFRLDPIHTDKVMSVLKSAANRVQAMGTQRFVGLIGASYQKYGFDAYSDLAYQTSILLASKGIPSLYRGNQVNAEDILDGVNKWKLDTRQKAPSQLTLQCDEDRHHELNGFTRGDNYIGRIVRLFEQKVIMTRYAQNGHIFFPGGTGTKDYLFELLCLIQTHKTIKKPIVLMGSDYWKPWAEYFKNVMVPKKVINPDDLNLFHITDNPYKAVRIIENFISN